MVAAEMMTLREALDRYPQSLKPLPAQTCELNAALGRVLAEPAMSAVDLPLFTQSAVDGYALNTADAGRTLKLAGDIPAGSSAAHQLAAGTAMRILTGGALPEGADTRYRGEELKRGEIIAKTGQRLHSGLLAALAMAGVAEVRLRRRPRIAVLVTGDEIAAIGTELKPGQVYDANGPLVRGWVIERGYPAPEIRYVPDRPEAVEQALAEALASADFVISTGGVSVGDRDYLPDIAPTLGVEKIFWQVAQKPGKPLWFGVKEHKALLGIPGNPAAVAVCLAVHARCVLGVLEGRAPLQPEWRTGILEAPLKADAHRDRLVRVSLRYDENGRVLLSALPKQDSHMLSNLGQAAALAWLKARALPYAAGAVLPWLPLCV